MKDLSQQTACNFTKNEVKKIQKDLKRPKKKYHMIILQRTVCNNFKEPKFSLKITKFSISPRGPRLWNKILDNNTKAFTPSSLFQETRMINLENVVSFF